MATFVLIHGAGDVGWYWHLAEARLRARGQRELADRLEAYAAGQGLLGDR